MRCKVCLYRKRAEIEQQIAERKLTISKAALLVGCSYSTVSRHIQFCVGPQVAEIARQARETQGINVLQCLTESYIRTLDIRETAINEGELRVALKAQEVELKQLAFFAKLTGLQHDAPEVNFLLTPEYMYITRVIIKALEPYPDAKQSVARALQGRNDESLS